MKLDPRIRSKEDILTPFDTDRAKQFIGEECFFTGTVKRFADNYFATIPGTIPLSGAGSPADTFTVCPAAL